MIFYWYWTIALAYVLLVFLTYVLKPPTKSNDTIHKVWKRLSVIDKQPKDVSTIHCNRDEDCPKNYACLDGGECVPRLMRGGDEKCNPKTGRMQKFDIRGVAFAVCVCLFPHLFTQKRFGSDCNVKVACGVHGRYDMKLEKCICDDGYIAEGLNCRPKTAIEQPCQDGEVDRDQLLMEYDTGFHRNYLTVTHADKKCFKRPCTFDALTGRPLRDSHFSKWVQGCVCNPSLGQFGVHLSISNYTEAGTKGYNACASIFKDNDEPIDVDIYAYFYMRNRDPVVFYSFRNVNPSSLNPDLGIEADSQGNYHFMVGQMFPFDYMQYLLKKYPEKITTRTRRVQVDPFYNLMEIDDEWVYKSQHSLKIECKNIPDVASNAKTPRSMAYDMLYAFPACHEDQAVVLNPQHISYRDFPNLFRSNGLKLSYRKDAENEWVLDLSDVPYQIHLYYDE